MKKIIKRKIFEYIEKQLFTNNNKILILLGPRQVGKTTIMKYFFEKIKKQNKKTLFLDLDIYENYEKISSYSNFINYLIINGYNPTQKDFFYIFLDEFQHYKNLTKIFKNIYDNHSNIKIIASGSSSLMIKNNIQESLAGRKRIIYIYPLNFKEFLLFKNYKDLYENFDNLKNLKGENLFDILKDYYKLYFEFIIWGGYPSVCLENDYEEKKNILKDIFDLFIKKDILDYLKLDNIKTIKDIIQFIAINHGQKIQYNEISKITNTSIYQIKNYIELLKENFLIYELKPYYTNKNLEITKLPKFYFLDNGVRNYFIKNFIEIDLRTDKGVLFESTIISEFIKKGIEFENLKYRRDKNKREIDLIIDNVSEIIPYEIKFKKSLKKEDLIGLKQFYKQYKIKGFLINLDKSVTDEYITYLLPFQI